MKLIYKIAMIGTVLASGIVTASAQTARRSYDQPNRYGTMQAPSEGSYYNGGYGGWNDPSSYRSGDSNTNAWATPGNQEQRDLGNLGG